MKQTQTCKYLCHIGQKTDAEETYQLDN